MVKAFVRVYDGGIQVKFNSDLKYVFFVISVLLIAVSFHSAYGVVSVDWISGNNIAGSSTAPYPGSSMSTFNIFEGTKLTVRVDASDEGFAGNEQIDKIDVLVTSTVDSTGVAYTLTESENDDGIFFGDSFVFLEGDYKFDINDVVKLIIQEDPDIDPCGSDNTITTYDSTSSGAGDGIYMFSDTDPSGLGFVLTETSENSCTFIGILKFTTNGSSNESTGTLKVSQGDILTLFDPVGYVLIDAQIIPTIPGKGSIRASPDDPDSSSTAEVTVSYHGLLSSMDLNLGGEGGRGAGGLIRPGLVIDAIGGIFNFKGSDESAPPTLGLDINQKRIVDGGFSFNNNTVDVLQYYTPYPLITTPVGQNNTIKLKIYEEEGLDNIAHVGLSYGLGKGETFNEGRATIEYDKTFDGIESVTTFDPHHVLGDVNVTTTDVRCGENSNAVCREFTFYHVFRAPLEYNMVATNIWDFQRNGWQNYFNHGIQIVGDSMNPPEQYSGIYQGHIYHLTEDGKNTAIDEDGNYWTFDKTWNRDYIKPIIIDSDILNQKKIGAIEKLGFGYSDGKAIFGFDRMDHRFADSKDQQQNEAQNIMNDLCPECQKKPFEKINDIFSYDIPSHSKKLEDPKFIAKMKVEKEKAEKFLKDFFENIHKSKISD